MKINYISSASVVLTAFLLEQIAGYPAKNFKSSNIQPDWSNMNHLMSDEELIKRAVNEFHSVDAVNDIDECARCKTRLQIGKFLALTRPDLVPQIFSIWCLESGFDETECHMNYGFHTEEYSSTGTDFTKVLLLMNPEGIDGDYFCYFHDSQCHVLPESPTLDLEKLWPPKPKLYEAPENSGNTFNVLHISDVNIQLDYKLLSEANCSQTVCCSPMSRNLVPTPPEYDYSLIHDPAVGLSFYSSSYSKGHFEKGQYIDQYSPKEPAWLPAHEFGSYNCETPPLLFNNSLGVIRDFHQNHLNFEFALFTGGVVGHSDRIFVDKESVLEAQEFVYRNIQLYLPQVPVFPAIGVRDGFPMNQLPQNELTESYLYQCNFDFLADLWQELGWLDLESAKEVRYNHFGYSLVTDRGLKIISLNSNVWNQKNLYSFWDVLAFDKSGIWEFLINELLDSELNEQRVWIIAHLPTSQQSLPIPSKIFTEIVHRFSPKVIAAIFFGHSQKELFELLYAGDGCDEKKLENAINFAITAPSISPFSGVNPAWKYYSVDENSFNIVNSFTYFTKLNETFVNGGAEPVWEFGFSARDAYDPEQQWPMERSLDTEWWHHVSEKIRDMPEIDQLYNKFEFRSSPFATPNTSEDCEESTNYCKVTSFTLEDRKQCMLTEDQDNYICPRKSIDFRPHIRPYDPIEYIGTIEVSESASEDEKYHRKSDESQETIQDSATSGGDGEAENVRPQINKSGSLRDIILHKKKILEVELAK